MRFCIRPRLVPAPALVLCLILASSLFANCLAQEEDRRETRDLLADIRPGQTVGVLELAPHLEIGRVAPGEILAGGSGQAIAAGNWTRGGASAESFEIETRLVRTMPAVWRMRVRDFDSTHATSVRCELTSPDGRVNTLTSIDDPSSVIQALVSPLPPLVVDGDLDYLTIEGGLLLNLDLQSVRTSGAHVGTLTVTLENY
jgi:hypothetical protein